ncbi:MAG: D-glycero-beta-D-manno-heptose-7-phosphate kinase [Bdellovibrionales bacterium]|nr:D-glycero-beta-D-manno-heptose-7-phosphate kinase [Bdellovibrionales bacterium]
MQKIKFKHLEPKSWNRSRLKKTLAAFQGQRVMVIGDVGVDRYTMGIVERISPEAPVPIVLVEEEKLKLGLAANVADNVQALGGIPLLTGVVGRDRTAEDFRGLLRTAGIEISYLIEDESRRTVLKERIVSDRQQLLRVDYESFHPVNSAVEIQLINRIRTLVKKVDAVILEDYAKGLLSPSLSEQVFSCAKSAKKIMAVDPNMKTPLERYRGAGVLTPNTKEAEKLSGVSIRDEKSLWDAGHKILTQTRADHVVITRGKEGMAVFEAGSKEVVTIPTYAREVYDVSGAGDTVISVLTLALSTGASIVDAVILGNLAAGVEVGKRGTATVSPNEIRHAMDHFGLGK